MTEAELDSVVRRGLVERRVPHRASTRRPGSSAGRAALARFRADQLEPGRVIPAYVEREFAFTLDGDRIRGRWDRVDIEPRRRRARRATGSRSGRRPSGPSSADVVEPTLALLATRERVTITDYKSSDVRDPAMARKRARESLQLQIYAMGYEAMTGRLPDAVQLHFLETGIVGSGHGRREAAGQGPREDRRGGGGHPGARIRTEARRARLHVLPFRDICPASAVR